MEFCFQSAGLTYFNVTRSSYGHQLMSIASDIDYFAAIGNQTDWRKLHPIFDRLLDEVHGNTTQSMEVSLAYYRQKCFAQQKKVQRHKEKIDSLSALLSADNLLQVLPKSAKAESNSEKVQDFYESIDDDYKGAIITDNFKMWINSFTPLISDQQQDAHLDGFRKVFPITSEVFFRLTTNKKKPKADKLHFVKQNR